MVFAQCPAVGDQQSDEARQTIGKDCFVLVEVIYCRLGDFEGRQRFHCNQRMITVTQALRMRKHPEQR